MKRLFWGKNSFREQPLPNRTEAMKRLFAVTFLLSLVTLGCGPREQKITINGTAFTISAPVPADKVSNPVEILKAAGAIPKEGATKGNYVFGGYWTAYGDFPSSPENQLVNAANTFTVYSYPDRKSLEKALAENSTAITDDSHKVLVGNNRNFYAVITGYADGSFDVDPAAVAARINASLRP
jgi:hypothetical protein